MNAKIFTHSFQNTELNIMKQLSHMALAAKTVIKV